MYLKVTPFLYTETKYVHTSVISRMFLYNLTSSIFVYVRRSVILCGYFGAIDLNYLG